MAHGHLVSAAVDTQKSIPFDPSHESATLLGLVLEGVLTEFVKNPSRHLHR